MFWSPEEDRIEMHDLFRSSLDAPFLANAAVLFCCFYSIFRGAGFEMVLEHSISRGGGGGGGGPMLLTA